MPGRSAILSPAMFALVVTAAISAQAMRTTHAADDCLAKPDAATPPGQHWYYRIDHANNNRQCWRLAPEGLPVQKAAPQSADATASESDAPQAVSAAPAQAVADSAPTAALPVTVPSVPWPAASPLPVLTQAMPQTASADDTVPVTASDSTPAVTGDPEPTGSVRADQSPRSAPERTPPTVAIPQQFAGIERTFVLLMVMFGLLGVTGPILHFTHRQRQREVINYKPPRWAPVVALNTPAPRVRVTPVPDPAIVAYRPARRAANPALAPNPISRPRPVANAVASPAASPAATPLARPVAIPPRPVDPNERLRHALQQLVDRIQTIQSPAIQSPATQSPDPRGARRHMQRADIDMMKSVR
jgi:hypothetical protein